MTVENLNITVKTNADKAAGKLNDLASAMRNVSMAATNVVMEGGVVSVGKAASRSKKDVEALSAELQETIENATKYQTLVAKAGIAHDKMVEAFKNGDEDAAWSAREREINAVAQAAKELERQQAEAMQDLPKEPTPVPVELQGVIQAASEVDILKAKLESLKAALQEAFQNGATDKAWSLRSQIISTEKALERAEEAARKAASGIDEVGKSADKTSKPLGNFLSSLKRIAFYRIIRGIIKSITQAFTEGLEKAYLFSAAMDGEGNRFAASMDRIKSAGNAMKLQLGSAFISLLTAIEPVILKLIDLVTRAADAISQLFAAFTGTKYIKANNTAAKFADTMKSGGRAAKEWRNQLLGFDEINRLNEPNQGGGGSSTNPLDGFGGELSPINNKILEFVNTLKERLEPALERLKGAFDRLKEAWDRFVGSLGDGRFLGDLLALGGDLVINSLTLLTDGLTLLLDLLTALNTGNWTKFGEGLSLAFQDLWKSVLDLVWDGLIVLADAIDALIPGEQNLADKMRALRDGTFEVTIATEDGSKEIYTMADAAADAAAKMSGSYRPTLSDTKRGQEELAQAAQDAAAKLNGSYVPSIDVAKRNTEMFEKTIGGLNDVIKGLGFKKTLHVEWNSGTATVFGQEIHWNLPNISWYAQGGFPDKGDLFIANEAGAEMVGSMGGHTAVANNDQIVEGIRQGVYEAVTAANGNGNNDVSVRVYLDSKEIKAGQQRLARAIGG